MSKARWVFIDTAAAFGGHEVMLLRWLTELQRQERVAPALIARSHTRLYDQSPEGVLTLPLSSRTGKQSRLKDIYNLVRHVMRLKPTLAIVAEGCLMSQAWITLVLRALAIKTVVYVPLIQSSVEMKFNRGAVRDWLIRHVYRHLPHAWITLTADQAKTFATWAGITRPVFVLPNTVAPEIEAAGVFSKRIHSPLRVLILGRLDAHQKGLDSLFSFLSNRFELTKDVHFTLAGDGPYKAEIEHQLALSPTLQQLITLQDWSATLAVMREHDVLLLASRYEGVPLVMLEAMALGIPVIATDLPGTRALLPAECLFKVGDYRHAMQLLAAVSQADTWLNMVKRNHDVFTATASGDAFTHAVDRLSDELTALNHRHRVLQSQIDNTSVIEV